MPVKQRHVMIDLETMGSSDEVTKATEFDCAIISIGAVCFDPRYNTIDKKRTFYRELDWQCQGRNVYEPTLKWWSKQSEEARASHDGLEDLEYVLEELSDWLPDDCKVWGNGPVFDIAILEHAYHQYGLTVPWKFWNVRDCRTIKDMYESKRGGLDKRSGGIEHNALDDAIWQAEYINKMWKSILGEQK